MLQDGNPVADLLHNAHLMGDDDDRDAHLGIDVTDQFQDCMGSLGIQSGGRLVAQQHVGIGGQRTGDGNTLLLTAGQLGRVGIRLVRQADHFQQLQGALFSLGLLHTSQLQGQHDVLHTGALHQQVEALEDHRHTAADGAQLLLAHRTQVAAIQQDHAVRGALQHVDAAHQRGLARAGHTDDAINIAVVDGQVDVAQRIHLAVSGHKALGEIA